MTKGHSVRRKKRTIHDANSSVSSHLTELLIQSVEKLPDCLAVTYLKDQYLTKFVSKDTDPASVRRQRAMNKWLAVERNNEATNHRLLSLGDDFHVLPHVRWSRFRSKLCSIVARIIGDTPPVEALIGSYSGGASTSRKRTESHPASKFTGQADTTSAALPWFELAMSEMPGWGALTEYDFRVVDGNEFFTVPKNTEIDRVACKEPDINMFLQKGVGTFIRRALRSHGVDLNDQGVNRGHAKVGSLTGSLATIDLSSASDSVSRQFVAEVLPACWFTLLDDIRSPVTVIDGNIHSNEMFSSMGNGFTFELESLLFYALARTTAYFRGISGIISVYGDDLIVPSMLAEDLYWVLDLMGFEVNSKKSFYQGPFRESCGGHYNNGVDITPFYLRKPIERLTDLITILNQIRVWADRAQAGILDPRVEDLWFALADHVPQRFWGGRDPSSEGQLYSRGMPRSKLVPRIATKRYELGGYVHWLCTTWVRDSQTDAVVTSEVTSAVVKYRTVPCREAPIAAPTPFFREVVVPVGNIP